MAEENKMAEEYDDMEEELDDIDAMNLMDDDAAESLFWSLKVPTKGTSEIEEPAMPGYVIHVTKACFGTTVAKGSRSVVLVNSSPDETPNYVPVCVLKEGTCENVNLDLIFNEQADFKVEGTKPSEVFLTGHLMPGNHMIPDEDDGMYGMDPDELDENDLEGMDEDLDDVEPDLVDEADEEDVRQMMAKHAQKKQKLNNKQAKVTNAPKNNDVTNNRKSPKTKPASPATAPVTANANANANGNNQNQNQNQTKNKKKNKKNKNKQQQQQNANNNEKKPEENKPVAAEAAVAATPEVAVAAPAVSDATQKKQDKKKKGKKIQMGQGLECKDLKQGNGAAIKRGDKVSVYYIGQLQNNQKIFDKVLNGNGFEFTVGAGQVIKGWDMGVIGMKGVGAKRKLWVPAKLAYGSESQAGIPANSELLFTVEIKKVN